MIADFKDTAEPGEDIGGTVGRESGPLVEPAGTLVVAQHPQRDEPVPGGRGPGQDLFHERAPGTGRPPGGTDVERVELGDAAAFAVRGERVRPRRVQHVRLRAEGRVADDPAGSGSTGSQAAG